MCLVIMKPILKHSLNCVILSIVLSTLGIVMLIATISVFFYAMSQLTEVSVGSFMGNGDLEITLPGVAESKILPCSWGPGVGFYLGTIAFVCLVATMFHKKIETWFSKG